jgi:hypothetical protein
MGMITLLGSPRHCCDGLTRRETLKVGALSALGGFFNLPSLLALEQNRRNHERPGQAKSVIVLYLLGGAPTQDMFDMKPAAPVEVRGEFRPVATSAPGIQICEHLPGMSRWMHKAAIVRTVNHRAGCHNTLPSYTGDEQVLTDFAPRDTFPPSVGSVCEYLKPAHIELPHYVYLPTYLGWGEAGRRAGPYGGFLGKRYDPLFSECKPYFTEKGLSRETLVAPVVRGEPSLADAVLSEGLTVDRLNSRRGLLQQLDDEIRRVEPSAASYGKTRARAFSLLTASKLKKAFDLEIEDPRWRDRYGLNLFGQSALVARRLVETGVRFVNVTWDCYRERLNVGDQAWDTHAQNFLNLKNVLLPGLDATFAALMSDLDERGLLDETLVVVMSDFGRTPNVNANAGRDHWSYCYSVLLAGAGIRGGSVYGESDRHAASVRDRPVKTGDICATIYRCLGIDPEMLIYDRAGRPIPVAQGGRAIEDILV